MKKVITYGTFDVFHYGHFYLLERAAKLGDHLTVAVSTDEFNLQKGKKAMLNWAARCHILQNISFVDEVIAEENWSQKVNDVNKFNIDVFVIGDDWKGKFDFLNQYCEVTYLNRTKNISSTLIRREAGAN
jgi:glycerol-3-phosphate cytidylyltransferase